MEASGVFGAAAAIAAFAGGALCAQAVLRRTRRRRAGEGGIGQHLARNGVRCADGVARRLLSVPKVAALAVTPRRRCKAAGWFARRGACVRLPLRRQRRWRFAWGWYPPRRSPALP